MVCCPVTDVQVGHIGISKDIDVDGKLMKHRIFSGAATALATPMREDGKIDYQAMEKLLEFQIDGGIDALVVMGTTGEASTLDKEERKELTRYTLKTVDKKVPVIIGTGSNDTRHAIMLSREAEELGADGLLLVTPYYNKTSQEGLIQHYFMIADQVSVPIIIYNVPTRTGVNICPETARILAEHPRICGIKEASGNLSQVAKTARLCRKTMDIYSGNDDQILPVLSLGGCGVISVLGNIMPRETAEICRLYQEGKRKESTDLQLELLDIMNAMFWDVNPVPVKAALSIMGICRENCRLPLVPLKKELKEELRRLMENHGLC